MVLTEDTLYKLHISLETATNGTPYYNQFKSIYNKTSLLLGDVTDSTPYFENYIVYGKKMDGLFLGVYIRHIFCNKILIYFFRLK